jgi:RNA polymerase sigma-70 factor (ECF subfamily)
MDDALVLGRTRGPARVALVRRARAGEHEAFDELIRPTLDRQLRFAMTLLHDETDARDVVQEACLRAWRDLPRLRDETRFDSWLNQILFNAARSHLRRRRRIRVRELTSDEIGADPHRDSAPLIADSVPEQERIRQAFDRLDTDKRLLLALHYVDGRPVAEIAHLLGIPEGTAKWRLHAARNALEAALEAEDR